MKRVLAVAFILLVSVASVACGGAADPPTQEPESPGVPEVPRAPEVIDLTPSRRTSDTTLEAEPFSVTLAMEDGTTRVVEVVNYEIYTGDVPLAHSFYRVYRATAEAVEGALYVPGDLELREVEVDDSGAVDGIGRRWVMRFDETLGEMEEEERTSFLLALSRTIIEGNPFRRDPPNFTGVRFFSGDEEIDVDYAPSF